MLLVRLEETPRDRDSRVRVHLAAVHAVEPGRAPDRAHRLESPGAGSAQRDGRVEEVVADVPLPERPVAVERKRCAPLRNGSGAEQAREPRDQGVDRQSLHATPAYAHLRGGLALSLLQPRDCDYHAPIGGSSYDPKLDFLRFARRPRGRHDVDALFEQQHDDLDGG